MTTGYVGFPPAPMTASPFLRAFHCDHHLSFTIDHYILDLDIGNAQGRQDQSKFIFITHDITSQQLFDFGYFSRDCSSPLFEKQKHTE